MTKNVGSALGENEEAMMKSLYLLVPLAPLAGALVAGLFGSAIGRAW